MAWRVDRMPRLLRPCLWIYEYGIAAALYKHERDPEIGHGEAQVRASASVACCHSEYVHLLFLSLFQNGIPGQLPGWCKFNIEFAFQKTEIVSRKALQPAVLDILERLPGKIRSQPDDRVILQPVLFGLCQLIEKCVVFLNLVVEAPRLGIHYPTPFQGYQFIQAEANSSASA